MEVKFSGRNSAIALAFLLLPALVACGCGSSAGGGESGGHPDYDQALAGAPAALAALHRQTNEVLPGGIDAYEKRIESLRGYPIVVNIWASWCNPCRYEFPALQDLSARYGKRVAFLGVDSEDDTDAAETFLEEEPVPYPSYSDPDKEIFGSLGARGFPDTAFYDSEGELINLKQGQYADQAALEEDIRRYALKAG
ncbi:MAG TPA: TlpA disulfide reductase family protein [Solirubrobacterales bacterium]|jgi:cytochrome c biogenesis protein CcmG/thiol:disulfide interchange protein DsbE|nr:TlpA disulfide reductase family protein [Solirubrobacterales bacterium]